MCGVCGCSETHSDSRMIEVEKDIMAVNNNYAELNRQKYKQCNCLCLNLVSSPGSGKTSLLEKTLGDLSSPCAVIEGDQYTQRDADRIKKCQKPVIQINTGKTCHLDAHSVGHAFDELNFNNGILFIENVGNLVCPALFDIGEHCRIVILSVTEGDDKPLKYQEMFATSDVVIINKIDLLPYVNFDIEECVDSIKKLSPKAKIFQLSATTGEGLNHWLDWLESECNELI